MAPSLVPALASAALALGLVNFSPALQAPALQVKIDGGAGPLVVGQRTAVNVVFTNTGTGRVKVDAASVAGSGLRARAAGAEGAGEVMTVKLDDPPFEIPSMGSLTVVADVLPLVEPLAGKADTVEIWYEASGVKSPATAFELVENLTKAIVVFETSMGTMKFKVDPVHAPLTSRNFVRHAQKGTYSGTSFHRVLKGFMAQGGDPNSKNENPADDGQGGSPFNNKVLPAEITDVKHQRGTLSMARNGDPMAPYAPQVRQMLQQVFTKLNPDPRFAQEQLARLEREGFFKDRKPFLDTAGSQFFICFGPTPQLDGGYTAFGQMIEGDETLKKIEGAAAMNDGDGGGRPKQAIALTKAYVETAK
jgi:cyclophilin family peptidyl-prolyl cis-trans isomerase